MSAIEIIKLKGRCFYDKPSSYRRSCYFLKNLLNMFIKPEELHLIFVHVINGGSVALVIPSISTS